MKILNIIEKEIQDVLSNINNMEVEDFVCKFNKSKRIFVTGEGRSGLISKCFAMRLMHLGYNVFVIGETITPYINTGDIFIAISGSGASINTINDTKKAIDKKCDILVITSKPESELAKLAQTLLIIPGTVKGDIYNRKSIQLLSSLFDQSLHIILDAICLLISYKDNMSNEEASKKHW